MKNILILFTLIICFTACKKSSVGKGTYYINGHLYDRCGGIPIKNKGLSMFQISTGGEDFIKGNTVTDSNGYFKLEYKTNRSSEDLEIRYTNSNYAVLFLDGFDLSNKDTVKIYNNSTCDITVKLNVTNPKTSADTLFVDDARNPGTRLKIAGPFLNGYTVYTAFNFNLLVPFLTGKKLKMGYYLNTPIFNGKDFNAEVCKNNIVTIDIN